LRLGRHDIIDAVDAGTIETDTAGGLMQTTIDVIYDGEVLRPHRPLRLKSGTHCSIVIDEPVDTPNGADALSVAAWGFYEENLKQSLEPAHNGQVVAIHPESGDYEVAASSPRAWKALRKRQPDGQVIVLDIGVVSDHNPLAARNNGLFRGSGS
jgi:predicted DNA-binding antitoxin AbrB/MazE fold protein